MAIGLLSLYLSSFLPVVILWKYISFTFLLPCHLQFVGDFFNCHPCTIIEFLCVISIVSIVIVMSIIIAKVLSVSSILTFLLFGKKI